MLRLRKSFPFDSVLQVIALMIDAYGGRLGRVLAQPRCTLGVKLLLFP